MTRLFYGILIMLCCCLAFSEHPVYLSTADIDYNTKSNRLEIMLELFPDDLSEALSEESGRSVEIGTKREPVNAEELVVGYLEKRVEFEVNGKAKAFRYIGRELVKERFFVLRVYLEVPNVPRLKTLSMRNSILVHWNEEQKNYVNFRADKSGSYSRSVAIKGDEVLVLK